MSERTQGVVIAYSTVDWVDPGRLVPGDERSVLVMLARDWLEGIPAPSFVACEARAHRVPSDPEAGADIGQIRWVDTSDQELYGVVAWAEMPDRAIATRTRTRTGARAPQESERGTGAGNAPTRD